MDRRTFLATSAGAALAAVTQPKVTKLWKSPDGHPNALESTPEGLWVGEQTTDRAYLLDWKTGKVLRKVETESSNTSGIAYGGGSLWMGANGKALGREPRPTDAKSGEIVEVDPATGKTKSRHPVPDGGGVHGVIYVDGKLWMTCFKWQQLVQVDPKSFEITAKIPLTRTRAHGLAWDKPYMWIVYSNDYVIEKADIKTGKVVETIQLLKGADPDPHGMDIYKGRIYYCDAGIAPQGVSNQSPSAGYICRIEPAGS